MALPLRFPMITPAGARVELFDKDDPILRPHPLVIQGSLKEVEIIYRKYCHYRMWHKLEENEPLSSKVPTNPGGRISDAIQAIYWQNEDTPDFSDGVDSVTLIYPKAAQPWVTQQLARWPQRLSSRVPDPSGKDARKSIHVEGRKGTKSLAVFEECLDIDVPGNVVHICLNNPASPSWVVAVPRDRSPMTGMVRPVVLNEQEVSEQAAWERVSSWLRNLNQYQGGMCISGY